MIDFEMTIKSRKAQSLNTSSPLVKQSMIVADNGGKASRRIATGKAEVELDTNFEDALAWFQDYCSRERMRVSLEESDLPRFVVSSSRFNEQTSATIKLIPWPLRNREFVVSSAWIKQSHGSVVVCGNSQPLEADYGLSTTNCVKGRTTTFCVFEKLGDERRCKVTLYQVVDFGGSVPISIINSKIPYAISIVDDLMHNFNRDVELDFKSRSEIVTEIKSATQYYDANEMKVLDRICETFDSRNISTEEGKNARVIIQSSDRLVELEIVKSEGGALLLRACVVVDDCVENCVAWDFLSNLRIRASSFYENGGID